MYGERTESDLLKNKLAKKSKIEVLEDRIQEQEKKSKDFEESLKRHDEKVKELEAQLKRFARRSAVLK
jgi:septal ring factor EnvC (AmiA/AmiB activator)